jgi:TRAP-type mannitol/chloroaromatic compound transport system permease small subunit
MRPHPYLRAYMAGIVVPTLFLLVIVVVQAFRRYYFEVPSQFILGYPALPLDRTFLFPMAAVPNAWGLWNMLYLALRPRLRLPVGIFGSFLVLILVPGGVALTRLVDSFTIQMDLAVPMIPIGMGVYYLAWKYAVGPLNAEMGIA